MARRDSQLTCTQSLRSNACAPHVLIVGRPAPLGTVVKLRGAYPRVTPARWAPTGAPNSRVAGGFGTGLLHRARRLPVACPRGRRRLAWPGLPGGYGHEGVAPVCV